MAEVINAAGERHHRQMEYLAVFLELSKITYRDKSTGEDYILTRKDGKELVLNIRGNKDQGGFLCVDIGLEPFKMNA